MIVCHYWAGVNSRGRKKLIVQFMKQLDVELRLLLFLWHSYSHVFHKYFWFAPPPLFFWWIKVKFKDWRSSGWAKQGPLFNKYALTTYCLPGTAVCIGITKIRKLLEYNGTHNNSTKCCKNTVNWVTALNVLYLNLSLIQFVCVLALPVLPYNPGSFLLTKNLSYSIYLFLHVYRKKRISSYFQYLKF